MVAWAIAVHGLPPVDIGAPLEVVQDLAFDPIVWFLVWVPHGVCMLIVKAVVVPVAVVLPWVGAAKCIALAFSDSVTGSCLWLRWAPVGLQVRLPIC